MRIYAPKGLGPRAKAFWSDAQSRFDFTPAETELLIEACRQMDELDSLAADVRRDGTTLTGSGSPRLHPAIAAMTAGRSSLAKLLALVGLPYDDPGAVPIPSPRQVSARNAAQVRWAGHVKDTSTKTKGA